MDAVRRYTVTSAIDAAFRLYRTHFLTLFLISLAITMTWFLFAAGLGVIAVTAGVAGGVGLFKHVSTLGLLLAGTFGVAIAAVIALVVWSFGVAATTRAAVRAALGQRPGIRDALASAASRFAPLLWGSVLASLLTTCAALACLLPVLGSYVLRHGSDLVTVATMIVCGPVAAVVALVLQIGFSFVGPVVVVEGVDGTTAVGRSWQLTRGRRGKIFLVSVLALLLMGIAQVGAAMIGQVIELFGPGMLAIDGAETLGSVVGDVCSAAISVIGMPLLGLAQVLLYFDGRVDHDAFDVQMLAKAISNRAEG